jgi:hypothetical protein
MAAVAGGEPPVIPDAVPHQHRGHGRRAGGGPEIAANCVQLSQEHVLQRADAERVAERAGERAVGAPGRGGQPGDRGSVDRLGFERLALQICAVACDSGTKTCRPPWVLPPWQRLPPPSSATCRNRSPTPAAASRQTRCSAESQAIRRLAERIASPKASKSSKVRQQIATVASASAAGHGERLVQGS